MRQFAQDLGFEFESVWAYYMPYENVADLAEGKLGEAKLKFVREQFALPIERALELAREQREKQAGFFPGYDTDTGRASQGGGFGLYALHEARHPRLRHLLRDRRVERRL